MNLDNCVARRHISPAAFVTYDAMLATAKAGQAMRVREGKPPGALVYKGTLADLGNKNNRSKEQEGEGIRKLETAGWVIPIQEKPDDPKQRRNKRAGTWATCEYRVVEHDEFAMAHGCPPLRYDEKGNLIKAGTLAPGLRRANVRKLVRLDGLPDFMADLVADSIDRKKAATGKPVAATDTGEPVPVELEPPQETLYRAATGKPVSTGTGNPVPTDTGNPVTRFAPLPATSPASHPPAGESAGREDDFATNPLGEEPEQERTPEQQRAFEQYKWQVTSAHFPDEMQGAVSNAKQREEILAQVERCGVVGLGVAMQEWATRREPSLDGRRDKFGAWLLECGPFVRKQAELWRQKKASDEREG